jgi:hypothetical protein
VKRQLFNAGVFLSLVLCLAVTAIWILSYRRAWSVYLLWKSSDQEERRQVNFVTSRGGLGVLFAQDTEWHYLEDRQDFLWWNSFASERKPFLDDPDPSFANRWGFGFQGIRGAVGGAYSETTLAIPLWAIATVFGVLPAGVLFRRAISRREHVNRCPACGYDLRGTPSGGGTAPGSGTPSKTCPECGAASASPASPAKA